MTETVKQRPWKDNCVVMEDKEGLYALPNRVAGMYVNDRHIVSSDIANKAIKKMMNS